MLEIGKDNISEERLIDLSLKLAVQDSRHWGEKAKSLILDRGYTGLIYITKE